MMKIREGYGMTRDGRKVKIARNGVCEELPFFHDHGEGSFHGLTAEGKSCIDSDQDDIVSMIDDDASSPVRTVTRREVVGGVYGDVGVSVHPDGEIQIEMRMLTKDAKRVLSAAMILSQIAEALDDKEVTE